MSSSPTPTAAPRAAGAAQPPRTPRHRARERAMQALYRWQLSPASASELIAEAREQPHFSKIDAAFFEHLLCPPRHP